MLLGMSNYISISGIRKSYKKREVLKGIELSACRGDIIGIIGSNGSGKSTLLSILAGVLPVKEGIFECNGNNLLNIPDMRQKMVGYVPQGNALIEELNARDNLLLWADRKVIESELRTGVLAMLGIDEFINTAVHKMSGGMKKRLAIGCTVINHPEILLLDEPCSALDIVCKDRIYDYFRDFTGSGGTIIMATHDIYEIELCSKCYILKEGVLTDYGYDGNAHRLASML